jgi:histidinol-phosphate aminotransferase
MSVASASEQGAVMSGTQFLRPHLLKLAAYTPIEPFEILSARYGRKPEDIVKLDANENPYGPPPEVREALGKMSFPHIYPDPETRQLRQALAKMHDIPKEHLLVRGEEPMQHTSRRPSHGGSRRELRSRSTCGSPGKEKEAGPA